MSRRLGVFALLTLAFSGLVQAAHFNCTLSALCNPNNNGVCDWATAGNWSSCNSDYPHNGANTFTATIPAGASVNLNTDGITLGLATQSQPALTINGTLEFSTISSTRDAQGFRTLTLKNNNTATIATNLVMGSAGYLRMRAGDRIALDTTAGTIGLIDLTSGSAIWDVQGTVTQTTVDAVTAAANNALCDNGSGANGAYITVTLHTPAPNIKQGRRILFQTGQLRAMQYEIQSVALTAAGQKIGFCSSLTDSASNVTCNANTTCGQRLTPHVSGWGKFPDATPTANTRHWTVAETLTPCSAAFTPFSYCTGSGAGTALTIAPKAGDTVALIDDAWVYQTGGTAGYRFRASNITDGTYFPYLYATNYAGIWGLDVWTPNVAGTRRTGRDIKYCNFHDFADNHTYDLSHLYILGFSDFVFQWNAVHDQVDQTGVSGNANTVMMEVDWPPNDTAGGNVQLIDNVVYRSAADGLIEGTAGSTAFPSGFVIARNRMFEGCTNSGASTECRAIEINNSKNVSVYNNLIYDWFDSVDAVGSEGMGIIWNGASSSAAWNNSGDWDNIIVNVGLGSGCFATTVQSCQRVSHTRNYISNTFSYTVIGGKNYSGFYRNNSVAFGFTSVKKPLSAYGTIVMGADPAVNAAKYLASYPLFWGADSTLNTGPTLTFQDDIFGWYQAAGASAMSPDVGDTHDGPVTINHVTIDGGGNTGGSAGIYFAARWTPAHDQLATVTDFIATHMGGLPALDCSTTTHGKTKVGTYFRSLSGVTAEKATFSLGDSSSCTPSGTAYTPCLTGASGCLASFRNRNAWDYSLPSSSPLLTQASDGGSLGSRAFRFNKSALDSVWGGVFPWTLCAGDATGATVCNWPADFSNGTCSGVTTCNQDSDGDGVLDIHDNCILTPNPTQYDGDANGKGYACDRHESAP